MSTRIDYIKAQYGLHIDEDILVSLVENLGRSIATEILSHFSHRMHLATLSHAEYGKGIPQDDKRVSNASLLSMQVHTKHNTHPNASKFVDFVIDNLVMKQVDKSRRERKSTNFNEIYELCGKETSLQMGRDNRRACDKFITALKASHARAASSK